MKLKTKILFTLLIITCVIVLRTLWYSGAFRNAEQLNQNQGQLIKGMIGAEDITIDHELGVALVSSYDRRKVQDGIPVKGAIYLFDFKTTPAKVTDLTKTFDQSDFRPHGISLYIDPTDQSKWLYTVNHRTSGHFIEIFKFSDSTLTHSETISHEMIRRPNDVVGTGKKSFYFTNDHDKNEGIRAMIEDLLLIGTGSIGYFDGTDIKILDQGIRYANGINISKDGKKLYVSSPTDGNIYVYSTNPLKKIQTIKCNTGVDNLEWDDEGNLWVGAHHKLLSFLKHSKSEKNLSPSHIIKIDVNEKIDPKITNIYLNDGRPLSGSSVAAVYKNNILMGSVFEDGVLLLSK